LIVLQFDRHKRVLGDYIKRGYIKKYEDAFADLEKTAAALPAEQADQFRGFLLHTRPISFISARKFLTFYRRCS
jgi:hypothetical protein